MTVQYTRVYSEAQAMIDSVMHDSDPAQRLSNIYRLTTDLRRLLIDARDEAAYDLRVVYASEDSEKITGVSRRYIDYWAKRWRTKRDLPRLKNKRRVDLSEALDLRS